MTTRTQIDMYGIDDALEASLGESVQTNIWWLLYSIIWNDLKNTLEDLERYDKIE